MATTFNGTVGEIDLGASLYTNLFAGGGTVMGWINAVDEGENGFGRPYAKADNTGTDTGWAVYTESDGAITFAAGHVTTGGSWSSDAATITFGTWHHVAFVYDSDSDTNDPLIYIDGVSVNVTTGTAPVGAYGTDAAFELLIGNFSAGNRTFNGELADMRGYDRELTANEILTIFTLQGVDSIQAGKQWHLPLRFTGDPGPDAFRDAQTTIADNVTTFDADTPTTVEDDLMFLLITVTAAGDPAPVVSNPGAEWTLIEQLQHPVSPSRCRASIWRRQASASEPADYNFTSDIAAGWTAIMCSYEVDTVTVDEFLADSADNGSPTCPSVTAGGDALVIRTWSSDDDELPITQPSGTTLRASVENIGVGNNVSAGLADEFLSSGATGTALWTGVGIEEWVCWTITFLNTPLPVAGGTPDVQDIGPNTTDGIPSGPLVTKQDELRHTKRRRAA